MFFVLVYIYGISGPNFVYQPRRLLTYEDGKELSSVVSVVGQPEINDSNFDKIHIDHSIPRAWIEKSTPVAATPAVGTSTACPIQGICMSCRKCSKCFYLYLNIRPMRYSAMQI